jgi:hypothetical protein
VEAEEDSCTYEQKGLSHSGDRDVAGPSWRRV